MLIDGVLLVDKPQGWTSHDVCAFVRKKMKIKKVGHAGTLDPMATGLLVVLLGRATKKSMELSGADKDYFGVMELGVKTDSHDRTGQVLQTAPWENVSLEEVRSKAAQFTGEILQVPPMVSALKHNGMRLYELARRGVDVPRQSRPVKVYELLFEKTEGPYVYFSSKVSKGTYVRTLVNDIGESLGCFAALKDLRRSRSGGFKLEDAITVDDIRSLNEKEIEQRIIPLYSLYAHLHGR